MVCILVGLIMRFKVNNRWIEELLKQYFSDLLISDDAEIIIIDDKDCINIELKASQQQLKLTKPISITNLINIILSANHALEEKIIGPIKFYPQSRICIFQNQEIRLTSKESEVLLCLYKQFPNYISKLDLLELVWGYSKDITTHTLETHIYKLRNKFADKYEIIISNEEGYLLNCTD